MKFLTAGESHGKGLTGILEGVPSGLCVDPKKIAEQLHRRQRFYGRSNRMKIENDTVEFLAGFANGKTATSPIAFFIENVDYRAEIFEQDNGSYAITKPRAGHADYAGMVKYGLKDARMIAERASGRETAARTVIGAIAREILSELRIESHSHVLSIGGIQSTVSYYSGGNARSIFIDGNISILADGSSVRCLDENAAEKMVEQIDNAKENGDTLGGEIELVLRGLPIGFGSFASYDKRLDYNICAMLMSIPSVKGVHIGNRNITNMTGSEAADAFVKNNNQISRQKNDGGGLEGGMSNGEDIVITLSVKPVPTTKKGSGTIDMTSGEACTSHYERSDTCVVPTISVVAENLLCYAVADTIIGELGGNTMTEIRERYKQFSKKTAREFLDS